MNNIFAWTVFGILVCGMMFLDLGVFNRKAHEVKIKEALIWSGLWIGLAFLFNLGILIFRGHEMAMKFLAGYLLEESLSVDNLFVFLLIFNFFKVPSHYQHKTLYWGIMGAIIFRIIFIAAGVTLISRFHWILYIFGALLIVTAYKLAFGEEKEVDPAKNPLVKIFRKFMPVTEDYEHEKFFVLRGEKKYATPLVVVLLVIATTDIVFAMDSIPAVLGITTDSFVVYTSNIFAVLGLRSIFFALAGLMRLFRYLNYGLSVVLAFIGVKMLVSGFFYIPVGVALVAVASILGISILISVLRPASGLGS